ncbi:MAG: ATP-binding cassette domain-containing protein, partial [Sulfuricaulis sp.]|uniref:ATP-binding cassette domain-containing protein n=1 Tax=Sulfuricaulis sp. TaxID=2003553 RepID=UPI003C59C292
MTAPVIVLENVSFAYDGVPALEDVNLEVEDGEFLGLVGPNGGGKSTLLRIVATLLKPSAGDAYVFGANVKTEGDDVRRHIGFFAHVPG